MLLIGKAKVNDGPGVISNNEACVGMRPAAPVGRCSENRTSVSVRLSQTTF